MTKQPSVLYIVRHGLTKWNVEGRIQGQLDSPLTDDGRQQATKLAHELATIDFTAIYASDLPRAYETAQILAQNRELIINASEHLRERSFGSVDGKLRTDVQHYYDRFAMLEKSVSPQDRMKLRIVEDAENDEELFTRTAAFLREIAEKHAGETVLVVTHGAVMRTFLKCIGYATFEQLKTHSVGNTAYLKVLGDGDNFKVLETKGVTLSEPANQ